MRAYVLKELVHDRSELLEQELGRRIYQEHFKRMRDIDLRISRISMNSPLTIETIASGVVGAGGVSAVAYLFKTEDR
ncbi:hypothetical protein [Sphaerisporangium dianthi]|uniref:Uncharacterized protein n=1 Tax=Sphaerisporangium dianthi TaxID=1436120 RepID=A0ABV9CMG5_9ACTN